MSSEAGGARTGANSHCLRMKSIKLAGQTHLHHNHRMCRPPRWEVSLGLRSVPTRSGRGRPRHCRGRGWAMARSQGTSFVVCWGQPPRLLSFHSLEGVAPAQMCSPASLLGLGGLREPFQPHHIHRYDLVGRALILFILLPSEYEKVLSKLPYMLSYGSYASKLTTILYHF